MITIRVNTYNVVKCNGIRWNFTKLKFEEILWNFKELRGIEWNSLKFDGILWNPMKFGGASSSTKFHRKFHSIEFFGNMKLLEQIFSDYLLV